MLTPALHDFPRALQHLLARDLPSTAEAGLPRRAFLKLGAASGFALGLFPLAAQAAKWTATTPAASSSPSPPANPTSTPFREYAVAADQLTSCRLSFASAMVQKHHRIYGSHPHRFRHLEWRPVHALRPAA